MACLSALKKIKNLGSGVDILAWLKGVILNTILCHDRDERRLKRIPTETMVPLESCEELHRVVWSIGIPGSTSPEEEVANHEEFDRVFEILDAMPPVQSGLLILVHVRGLKVGEAARELHLKPARASRLLYEGKKTVQQRLEDRTRVRTRTG